ncbi:MAG: Na(+)-translocating NADH-quinone reductase subunit A [Gammaproteobacteria bacterium]
MARYVIKRGLDVPIAGAPAPAPPDSASVTRAAVVGRDYHELRPRLAVEAGQAVRKGEVLVTDARHDGIRLTAPMAGTVAAIHRGERRRLLSVVLEAGAEPDRQVALAGTAGRHPDRMSDGEIRSLLVESGLWSALRTRPFSRVPRTDSAPSSIFVTAMNSEPLAPDTEAAMAGREEELEVGLQVLARLTPGLVHVCTAPGSMVGGRTRGRISHEEFAGPHPAGLPGTHIHTLDPARRGKEVWHLPAAEAAAIGRLFSSGDLDTERVISLAGPGVRRPRLLKVRWGAATDALVRGELEPGAHRVIAGSVLSGHIASGEETGYLGRHDQQITVLPEGGKRKKPAWAALGFDVFSVTRAFMSAFFPRQTYPFDTSTHGAWRPMIPLEAFEDVMPLDVLPTPLLRALAARDSLRAENLGCLELAEEDLALCTFVDPGKNNWGRALRRVLSMIEKEG